MLGFEQTLEASREMQGGLGAIAHAMLTGLAQGGAPEADLARTRELLFEHLAKLSDDDCNVLCRVVQERLAADRRPDGRWYA